MITAPRAGPSLLLVRMGRTATTVADLTTLKKTLEASDGLVKVQLPGSSAKDAPREVATGAAKDAKPCKKYVIRPGDSLNKIARERLKDSSAAGIQKLLDANRSRIRDPKRIPIGMELEIPS